MLDIYTQAIQEAYPELAITSVQLNTADGQFNSIVVVNGELIFRFSRSEHVAADYARHDALLSFLAPQLPLPIPVPRYRSAANMPWQQRCIGYQRIPGEPLYEEALDAIGNPAERRAMAEQLARFLRALHQIPVARMPIELPIQDSITDWDALYQGIRTHLFPSMRPAAQAWTVAHFEGLLDHVRYQHYQPCLRHGDFGGSNILYDPTTSRISGIIDFDSTGLGDPAADVAALSGYGAEFFAWCLESYPEMQTMLERAAFYRGTFALQEAYYGLRDGNQEAFEHGIAQYR
jgi:aminoglycoside 2''-phosphotransferase